MADSRGRRVVQAEPGGPWLVVESDHCAVDAPLRNGLVPLEIGRMWLLPLLERPRGVVEVEAAQRLLSNDPDPSEALRAVIMMALSWKTDYWPALGVAWLNPAEVPIFAEQLQELALGSRGTQSTRHAAKRLLKDHDLWTAGDGEPAHQPSA